jgi:hypothetical protein
MNANTIRRNTTTYVLPVAVMTVVGALILAYGPAVFGFATELVQGLWDGIVATVGHLFAIGQHRPVSGLGCWDEVKASLPTEKICGDVSGAPASAVNFTAYPTN